MEALPILLTPDWIEFAAVYAAAIAAAAIGTFGVVAFAMARI